MPQINITVNGNALSLTAPLNGAELLAQLGVPRSAIVIERNGRIVPLAEFAETDVADGDSLEIVTVVGGG